MSSSIETIEKNVSVLSGGEFLVANSEAQETFVPEDITEEQKMVLEMTHDFVSTNEVSMQELDQQPIMMEEAGSLGLLGAHIPESYGGMGLDVPTNTFISDKLGAYAGSFGTTFAAHTGIGMLPILYFGTEEQKNHFLPKMASGEWKGAYCLTEPGSGSDALAAKTRADLNDAGTHYIVSGQKMWISNAGFADLLIVFAQIDGDKFTGFIIEANSPGITLGAEEKKLGIKGSSTRQVFFEKVKVPAENVLGEIGKGHLIAFNALNTGRFKLGNMCLGGAKRACATSIQYANERIQFKQPISNFGAIKSKIAEQAINCYALESTVYRIADLLEKHKQNLHADGMTEAQAKLKAAEEMAIECAVVKISGSEILGTVVDEMVQIHGGNGFSEEYPAARAYRDNRISRIYEGTNEINRMLMINMLFKRVMKGKIDLVAPAWAVQKELAQPAEHPSFDEPLACETFFLDQFKKLCLMVLGGAAKQQMDGKLDLKNEQEIMMHCADILIDILNAESLLLRVKKSQLMVQPASKEVYQSILKVFFYEANDRIAKSAKDAIVSFAEHDLMHTFLKGVQRFATYPAINVKEERRIVANHMIESNEWNL